MKGAIESECFHDEDVAREYLQKIRWPDGPVCPHCGNAERVYRLKGKSTRKGLLKCGKCRKQFTVTVGTLFEGSHIPLHKWLLAVYLMCSSKKGMSTHQIHRMLGITYRSMWHATHRIREAMKDPVFKSYFGGVGGGKANKLGGKGKVVEADETFWGNVGKQKEGARGWSHKEKIFGLVERKGKVRSFHVPKITARTLVPIMQSQISQDTFVVTDEYKSYKGLNKVFDNHEMVCHSRGEYVRGPIHTNTIENYFSILKRGLTGVFQHVGANHLRRYIGEFDFRYNNRKASDLERTDIALRGIEGKRLFYKSSNVTVN